MNPHDSIHASTGPRQPGYELRPKLVVAFMGMGAVILVASVFAGLIITNVFSDSARLIEDVSRRSALVASLRQEFLLLRVAEKNIIIEDTQEGMDVFEQRIETSEAQIDRALKEFESELSDSDRSRLAEFRAGFTDYRASLEKTIALSRSHTLAQAAELARGKGRTYFQSAREALLSLIERQCEAIAREASRHDDGVRVEQLTSLIADAREALEGLHDLQYLEQAILTVFSEEERTSLGGRLESEVERTRGHRRDVAKAAGEQDRADLEAFDTAFEAWVANNNEVRRLAQEDSKTAAMALSTTAVRDAYLRASGSLDELIRESESATTAMRLAHEKSMTTGRGLLLTVAVVGFVVIGATVWIVAGLIMREFRTAGEMLMRAP